MPPEAMDTSDPPVVFRAGKKRKAYRQRAVDHDDDSTKISGLDDPPAAPQPPPSIDVSADSSTAVFRTTTTAGEPPIKRERSASPAAVENDDGDDDDGSDESAGLAVSAALRLRNAARRRGPRGVEFRTAYSPALKADSDGESSDAQALVLAATAAEPDALVDGVVKRFAPQTGLIGELVNKHMEEYVESALARRHLADDTSDDDDNTRFGALADPLVQPHRPPAMQGRLQEIDLGDEARMRNEAMTDRARRRLQGESVDEGGSDASPRKVRIGKDGKPWRPRKRRGSDDVKRDQLVDEFLHENRLEVYDLPDQQDTAGAAEDEDAAADERIAAEFRQQFMEAMAQRRQRRRAAPAKKQAKNNEDVLRGPKLGGSRNVRAAMRDLLLAKEKEKRG